MNIPFNRPAIVGTEIDLIQDVISTGNKLCGDGPYTLKCHKWFEDKFQTYKAFLTPSCTAALEMAAILINIQAGDEVIMPSYTFVSTANAFVLRGAKIVFVDIRPDTMNIDETKIEAAISKKTKAIVPVHYAGVGCDMMAIMQIAKKHNLFVIEDAAQGMMAKQDDKFLGAIGHIGCFSFHETKNYTSGGEGGAILINDPVLRERAEVIREKGTDRTRFLKGIVDKYTWRDVGSSFLPGELQAAFLFAQLNAADEINQKRLSIWNKYNECLMNINNSGAFVLPSVPTNSTHNAHMFYIKLKNHEARSEFITAMKSKNISTVFHYIPLHSSPAGKQFGFFVGEDSYTTQESECLVRLPIWYNMTFAEVDYVCQALKSYFEGL